MHCLYEGQIPSLVTMGNVRNRLRVVGPELTDVLKDIICLLFNHVDRVEDGNIENKKLTVRATA